MEIPNDLKRLYKHWQWHTQRPSNNIDVHLNQSILDKIYPFMSERMSIWNKRQAAITPPYTSDPVLSKFRFCNIYRELDKQTIELHSLLKKFEDDFDIWLLNALFCRMLCSTVTLSKVGFLNYDPINNKQVIDRLLALPRPKYGVAYIFPISLIGKAGYENRENFFSDYLPQKSKSCANVIRNFDKKSVVEALENILPTFGLNFRFHWTEVLIDVAYQYPQYIDLFKSFPIGPGSLPTMLRLSTTISPEDVCLHLITEEVKAFPYLTYEGAGVWLSAESWEGIGCEFRKYTNLSSGSGRRRLFKI